jgi:signal transduction histidine kinase
MRYARLIRLAIRLRCLLMRLRVLKKRPVYQEVLLSDPDILALHQREAVHTILRVLRRSLGLRIVLVTKLIDGQIVACAALDDAGYGLQAGDRLTTTSTFCSTVCGCNTGEAAALLISHASADPRFRDHPAPRLYGIESYIAVPLYRPDGTVLGTLCALDPRPTRLNPQDLELLHLFSHLLTHELRAEEEVRWLQHAERFRAQVIGMLGHDLRHPLTAIQLSNQTLRENVRLTPELCDALNTIEQSATRMNRMIQELLDFTRSRFSGGYPILKEPTDLHDLCVRAIRECSLLHPDRNIDVELEGSGEGVCDPDRILQVLTNLICNALQYSPPDSTVAVRVDASEKGILLEVHNAGPPIPPEFLPGIFEPFVRVEGRGSGMGLGLCIVDQIVRAHTGTVEVKSDESCGTMFRVRLPASPLENECAIDIDASDERVLVDQIA